MRGVRIHGGPCPDFDALYSAGIRFALLSGTVGGEIADPLWREKMISAQGAGIRCGVYHRLLSQTPAGVLGEADFFLRCLAQSPIPPLWAICQVESHHRDPACAALLSRMFRERIRGAGYTPLLYTTREDLAGTPEMAGRGLCLAAWGIPEARALAYNPLLWEYGEGALPSLPRAVLVKGYLSSLPEFGRDFSFFLRNIKRKSSSNGKKDVIFSPKRRYIP